MHLTPHTPYVVPVPDPLAPPRDTVTATPGVGGQNAIVTAWDSQGRNAMMVIVAQDRATPELMGRIIAWVRGWEVETPPTEPAQGPRLLS